MIFENRRISDITEQDLIDLVKNQQEENLWLDFKQQDYHKDPKNPEEHKREICKDVTAMANAEGGYILIGVREENTVAHDFFTVDDAAIVAQSINDICLQYIDPRIPNLEIEPYPLTWQKRDIELVIIRIPASGMQPHSFKWKNSTNFVKRYGNVIREFPLSELIQGLLISYNPPIMNKIESQLASISKDMQRDRRNSISAQDDALDAEEVGELIRIMELRFKEAIAEQAYYRIFAVPKELNPGAVETGSENICNILRNPPNIRYAGFGVMGILERDMVTFPEGVKGSNMGNGEIILLKNGFLEVRCPLLNTHFQWMHDESNISTPWLYPHVVCEFPVSFLKLVKGIYKASGIDSSIIIQQEYQNLKGFLFPKGHQTNVWFTAFQDERDVYRHSHPIISKRTIESNFVPDHVAYDLVKEVYAAFRLDERAIFLFDENGNFTLE